MLNDDMFNKSCKCCSGILPRKTTAWFCSFILMIPAGITFYQTFFKIGTPNNNLHSIDDYKPWNKGD